MASRREINRKSKLWWRAHPEKRYLKYKKWIKKPKNKKYMKLYFKEWSKKHPHRMRDYWRKHPDKGFEAYKKCYNKKLGIDMDTLTPEKRNALMRKIKAISKVEIAARSLAILKAGCRLRHQPQGLYGSPDYANKTKKVIVRIQGCFFHNCPKHGKLPKINKILWAKNFKRIKQWDKKVKVHYLKQGWIVIDIWEHEVRCQSI